MVSSQSTKSLIAYSNADRHLNLDLICHKTKLTSSKKVFGCIDTLPFARILMGLSTVPIGLSTVGQWFVHG